jgi:transcriptional regulator with XRE-family HTH domain
MSNFSNLKEWLSRKMDDAQISPEQLANASQLSRASIYFYLTDRCRPDEQSMARICAALGAPLIEGLAQYTPKKRGRPAGKVV